MNFVNFLLNGPKSYAVKLEISISNYGTTFPNKNRLEKVWADFRSSSLALAGVSCLASGAWFFLTRQVHPISRSPVSAVSGVALALLGGISLVRAYQANAQIKQIGKKCANQLSKINQYREGALQSLPTIYGGLPQYYQTLSDPDLIQAFITWAQAAAVEIKEGFIPSVLRDNLARPFQLADVKKKTDHIEDLQWHIKNVFSKADPTKYKDSFIEIRLGTFELPDDETYIEFAVDLLFRQIAATPQNKVDDDQWDQLCQTAHNQWSEMKLLHYLFDGVDDKEWYRNIIQNSTFDKNRRERILAVIDPSP